MKKVIFLGTSKEDLSAFPDEARGRAGHELWLVQVGEEPNDWKAMSTVGAGVAEIRVRVGGEWRILYVARFSAGIYVLHAFQKKTQKTDQNDIEIARRRYGEIPK